MIEFPSHWTNCQLGERIRFEYGKSPNEVRCSDGKYPVYGSSGKTALAINYTTESPAIIVGRKGTIDKPIFLQERCWAIDTTFFADKFPSDDPKYLFFLLDSINLRSLNESTGVPSLSRDALHSIPVSLPPLPEQKKIAEILSGIDRSIQAEVNMASKITKQYQGVLSQIFDDASKQILLGDYLPLGDLDLDISDGNYSAKYPSASEFVERGVPFIRASNMKEGTIDDRDMRFISATKHQEITKGHLKSGDILIANRGEIGKTSRVPERHIGSNINAQVVRINGGTKIDSSFLFHYLSSPFCQTLIDELTTGTALKQLPIGNLVKLLIPAPEMSVQIATGGALDSMQRAMNAISEKIRKRSQLKQALASDLLSGRKRVSV
jgi:type I restriction enzyme, S subunit